MSSNERRKLLRSIFLTLSSYELREFRRWMDQVDFRCDLLSKFPLEITHQIFGYLPLHQCFYLRRVSKEWFRILSAREAVEHLLRFWYPKAEVRSEVSKPMTDMAVLNARAEHVDAYRAGKAFSMMKSAWYLTVPGPDLKTAAYANEYIAGATLRHNWPYLNRLHLE